MPEIRQATAPLSPLTGSKNVTFLKRLKIEELVRDWKKSFKIDISTELQDGQFLYLYQCNETKLNFFFPFNSAGSGKLYEQLQNFDWYYMPDKWEHQIALRDLSGSRSVIEIGAASGEFVKSGIDAGLDIRGIELNKIAAAAAREQGIPVDLIDLEEAAQLYANSLDAVCSFQVLEHVVQPREFINNSLKLLRPSGKLIYCVPNSESFLRYQYNLLDMPPHHMTRWSKYTFKTLERIFPIRLEKVRFEPLTSYQVSPFLGAYTSYFRSKFPAFKTVFNRVTLPIYKRCLNMGARRLFKGQSLYVQFRKLG